LKVNVNKKCFQRAIENGEELEKNCESRYGTTNFKRLGYVSLEEQTQRNNFKNPTKQEMIVYAKKFMIGADRAATGSTRCG